MKHVALALAWGALVIALPPAEAQGSPVNLGVRNATFEAAAGASLSGGGSYDPDSGLLQVRGMLRLAGPVAAGPLADIRAGERLRWEGANILPSISFRSADSAAEPERATLTAGSTLVMQAEFYRPGEAGGVSRRARMIVSASDLDPESPGSQNIWIEGMGFGAADVTLR